MDVCSQVTSASTREALTELGGRLESSGRSCAALFVQLVACAESPPGTQPTTAGEPASPTSGPTTAQRSTNQPTSEVREPVTTIRKPPLAPQLTH